MIQPKITSREFKKIIDREPSCNVSKKVFHLGKKKVLEQIMGHYNGQFVWLADYVNEIRCKNPGSTALVTTKINDL